MSNYGEECTVDSPERDRNPSPPPELQNAELLEADTIANTAFSKHWLFSTLMKLIEEVEKEVEEEDSEFGVDVDEELQNELCKLWDMSMNVNVAKFLHEFKALDIMMGVISKSKAPRVTEICVGILGNMACDQEISKQMSQDTKFIDMTLLLLNNRDPCTLVETTRLLYTNLSKLETSQSWISAIKDSSEFLESLVFILSSSTNCDLLRNTGELLDVLLDQEESLCEAWATTQLLQAQLEAIKQIGCGHSEALEINFHVFQLFSTTEKGVATLVECSKGLKQPLMKYLDVICEDEIVGLEGREGCLASALSVLNILFLSDDDIHKQLSTDEHFMRIILKILEPLYPWLTFLNSQHASQSLTSSFSDSSVDFMKNSSSPSKSNNNHTNSETVKGWGEPESMPGNSKQTNETVSSGSERVQKQKDTDESTRKHLSVLYNIVKGFLYDLVTSFCELEDSLLSEVLKYLNSSCSRTRLKYLLLTLLDTSKEPVDIVQWLTDVTHTHKNERFAGIIDSVVSGKYLEREDSGHSSTTS